MSVVAWQPVTALNALFYVACSFVMFAFECG